MLFVKTYQPQYALVDDVMWNRTSEPLAADNTTNSALHVASSSIIQNVTGNVSAPEGCHIFNFQDMPDTFLPWDNPDNIVSAEVEEMTRRLKDTFFLPVLFLIGGPANVINMAVFYRQGLRDASTCASSRCHCPTGYSWSKRCFSTVLINWSCRLTRKRGTAP